MRMAVQNTPIRTVDSATERHRILSTIGILTGLFLAAMDSTIINAAMPTVAKNLKGLHVYFLVFATQMTMATVTLPLWGRLIDLYGRQRFHFIGMTCFLTGAALAGAAPNMTWLIVSRGLQGLGAGALMPVNFTMIADMYPLRKRARMQGLISGMWGMASVIGPLVGGFITDHLSWRLVFWVNIPFGLASMMMVWRFWQFEPPVRSGRSIDIPGAVIFALAMGAFLTALGVASGGNWTAPETVGLFGMAVGSLAALVWMERRAQEPFISYRLFRYPVFRAATLTGFFGMGCLFTTTSYLPLFVQGVMGTGATGAGSALTPLMLAWMLFSIIGAHMLLKIGYRRLVTMGCGLLVVAAAALSQLSLETGWWLTVASMVLLGGGLGCMIAPMMIAVQNGVPQAQLGAATSLTQFSRIIGGALCVSMMGAFFTSQMHHRLESAPAHLKVFAEHPEQVLDPEVRSTLPPEALALLRHVIAESLHPIFAALIGVAGLAFLCSFFVPGGRAHVLVHESQRKEER